MHAQTSAADSNSSVQQSDIHIKKTIRLVEVEVIAKDKAGRPVTDLQAGDFSLKDNGRAEKVSVFSAPQPGFAKRERDADEAIPHPAVTSNRIFSNGHSVTAAPVVILMDLLNTPADNQPAMRSALVESLKRIRSNSPIALLSLGEDLKVLSDFTTDTSSLAGLLAKPSVAQQEGSGPEITAPKSANKKFNDIILKTARTAFNWQEADQLDRTMMTLRLIRTQLSLMRGRKSLIWIGGGLAVGPKDWPQVRDAIDQLNDADVGVYTVDARGVFLDYGMSAGNDELDLLGPWKADQAETRGDILDVMATNTGGVPYKNTNALDGAIVRAVEDNTTVYTLGFYPQHGEWHGKAHKIEVKVSRAGINLRYRSGYTAAPEAQVEAASQQLMLQEVAASPLEFPGIRFTVEVQAGKAGASKEPQQPSLVLHIPATEIRMSEKQDKLMAALQLWFIQRQPSGEDLTSKTSTFSFQLTPSEFETAMEQGITISSPLKLKPNTAKVRVLLRDSNSGRIGTVDVPVTAGSPPKS